MPKKTKNDNAVSAPAEEAKPSAAPAAPTPKPQAKKRAPAAKTPARKSAAKKSAKSASGKKSPASKPSVPVAEPSVEEIQLRAYFLSERRMQLSLPGDSANDWLEARRQLTEEAAQRKA